MPRKSKAQLDAEALVARAQESRLVGRRAKAYALHVMGWTQRQIGDELGLSQQSVSEDIREHRATLGPADVVKVRQEHLSELAMLRKSMFELATKEGAPVTAGKDGTIVFDPETREVIRDYSLRVNATVQLLKIMEREAKQLGTDAASKVEHSGEIAVVGSIEQEIAALAGQLGIQEGTTEPSPFAADSL